MSYGIMDHENSIAQTADRLAVDFLNFGEGIIETEGVGGAFSSTTASSLFRFSITEDTPFTYVYNIDPIHGRSEATISFRASGMPLTLIDTEVAGGMEDTGILPAGTYRINIFTRGFATSANGEPQIDPPYEYGLNFSLRLGEVLHGDLNLDGIVNLLDVLAFAETLANGNFQFEGDFNDDGVVNLLDVQAFIDALFGN